MNDIERRRLRHRSIEARVAENVDCTYQFERNEFMRLAFTTLACPDWSLEQAADAANQYGYEGLELRLLDGELISPDMDQDTRQRVRDICTSRGLSLCCIDTSFKVADPNASLEEAIGFVELAADLQSPLIRVFGGAPSGEDEETTATRSADRLTRLADRGRSLGVRVALETHDSFSSGERAARVLALVPDEYAGILWDTLNPFMAGETSEQTLGFVGDRLIHVHAKDGGAEPNPHQCSLLGEGKVPFEEVLRTITARGYDGWLSVEWEKKWQPQIAGPEVALPQYADKLRSYLAALS